MQILENRKKGNVTNEQEKQGNQTPLGINCSIHRVIIVALRLLSAYSIKKPRASPTIDPAAMLPLSATPAFPVCSAGEDPLADGLE
jgi:hypothetical protein